MHDNGIFFVAFHVSQTPLVSVWTICALPTYAGYDSFSRHKGSSAAPLSTLPSKNYVSTLLFTGDVMRYSTALTRGTCTPQLNEDGGSASVLRLIPLLQLPPLATRNPVQSTPLTLMTGTWKAWKICYDPYWSYTPMLEYLFPS